MTVASDAREYLARQIAPKLARKKLLLEELEQIDREVAPIEQAMAALAKTKTAKSLKKADVQACLKTIAEENPGITRVELEELAKDKLKKDLGFSLRGFPHLAKKCFAEGVVGISADTEA